MRRIAVAAVLSLVLAAPAVAGPRPNRPDDPFFWRILRSVFKVLPAWEIKPPIP